MEEEKIVKIAKPGKPWKIESFHRDFESADALRNKLMRIWKADEAHKGMQVKIHYITGRSQYAVKTRLHPDFEIKKEVKSGKKNRKSRKGDSNKRKADVDEASI